MALDFAAMDTTSRHLDRAKSLGTALLAALILTVMLATPAFADVDPHGSSPAVLAVGDHERRPIAPTQRDQLGLVLYAFMAVVTVATIATMRRQMRGERPQSDGEFRWR